MRIYPLFIAHAGCPCRCLFCRQEGDAAGDSVRSPEEAARRLEGMLPDAGPGEIAFYGGTFTLLPEEAQRAFLRSAQRFVVQGRAAGIRVSTRPDALSADAVQLLASEGVTTVEIGCQSFSGEVLRRSGRGHGASEAAGAVARLRAQGLRVGLQLMPGLPGGGRAEAMESLEAALALAPDFVRIYPAVVLRDTPMETLWKQGTYHPLSLEEAVDLCADLLLRCRRDAVPVIRLGLQGTPGLEAAVVAGPWHPAFGQLVRSRLWRRALARGAEATGSREAGLHPAALAEAVGHRRENLLWLKERFGPFRLAPHGAAGRDDIIFCGQRFALDALAG